MFLGVIADDFTGGTDIASFLVENGMRTVQLASVPTENITEEVDAIVISLKTRSCPAQEAIDQSLLAARWLKKQGAKQFYFKYCSTFDSSEKGNIGPVTDALLAELKASTTIICPSLPINGRSVYQGYLFVNQQLVSESSMKNHPITPMHDSNLLRLMENQSKGKAGLINQTVIEQGALAVSEQLSACSQSGINYVVVDTTKEEHLKIIAEATSSLILVTGGSGLAIGIAHHFTKTRELPVKATEKGKPHHGKTIVLSGSCSEMTNQQVQHYQKIAPSLMIDIDQCDQDASYVDTVFHWITQQDSSLAPLVYATADAAKLKDIQNQYGKEASSEMIEHFFATLAQKLKQAQYQNFIVAGGETSGIVAQSIGVTGFHIGPQIAPGVPWVKAINNDISLALKSGNFGDVQFFEKAQEFLNV